MAAIPPARTRSLRANAPNLRHPREQQQQQQQQSHGSSVTTATGNATSTRSLQHATTTSAAQGPSPLSLFLTNLRLLDLDLLPDWPGLTAATFVTVGSGTGAAQGQKKRVACVEWALFRLFEIYDADEARTKLQPFFPPRDQVQSVNLRAALLRGLEAAKKAGVLGKDTILRKTMLDDCKGERLEEVLAAFSTAVLKMVVAEEEGADATPAMRLALENRGYKDDKMDLMVLSLAHRASLCKTLRQRKEAGIRYKDFEDLLSVKEKSLMRRREEVKALNEADRQQKSGSVSKGAASEMRHTVRNNWAGNEQWMETLLYGEAKTAGDKAGPFGMPFERVWRRVEQSRLSELEESGVSLLEQLERRVRGHEERLARWERFRDGMRGSKQTPSRTREEAGATNMKGSGLDLGFGAHQNLQVGKTNEEDKGQAVPRSQQQQDFRSRQRMFIQSLEQDLASASGSDIRPREALGFLFDRQMPVKNKGRLSVPESGIEVLSEISDLEDDFGVDVPPEPVAPPMLAAKTKAALLKRLPERPKLAQPGSSFARSSEVEDADTRQHGRTQRLGQAPKLPRPGGTESFEDGEVDVPGDMPIRARTKSSTRASTFSRSRSISPAKDAQPAKAVPHEHHSFEPPAHEEAVSLEPEEDVPKSPISPAQDAADEILESMKNASPSPAKPSRPRHKLSLADRTRMSMARGSLLFAEEDEDEIPPGTNHSSVISPLAAEEQATNEVAPVEDLASRTRRSMAGFDKARQKAQIDRRRSIRKSKAMGPPIKEGSYFPKVTEEEGGVLAEELMAEEDMEAVFRSRPKIQASPIPSPTREWED